MGDIKFGDLKGEDSHGNRYFENKEYPYGEQHRLTMYIDGEKWCDKKRTAARFFVLSVLRCERGVG